MTYSNRILRGGGIVALVGFKGKNHPQQQLFSGPRTDVDERATPRELFDVFHRRWQFTVDAAALPENTKLPRFWSPADNGLEQDWTGERVWCNPPFSGIEPWARKATESTASLVVMLAPANRTEQVWWQQLIEPVRDHGGRLTTEFLPGRIRFGIGTAAPMPDTRPPFGCVLLIWTGAA